MAAPADAAREVDHQDAMKRRRCRQQREWQT